jgi:hypothetical protein
LEHSFLEINDFTTQDHLLQLVSSHIHEFLKMFNKIQDQNQYQQQKKDRISFINKKLLLLLDLRIIIINFLTILDTIVMYSGQQPEDSL